MAKVKCVGKSKRWHAYCDYLTVGKEYEVSSNTAFGDDFVYITCDAGSSIFENLKEGFHGYILEWVEEPTESSEPFGWPSFDLVEPEDKLEDESGCEDFTRVETVDVVNNPSHYNTGGQIECITYIEDILTKEEYVGYLRGNVAKYLHRFPYKNGLEDLKKAQWYLNKLVEAYDGSN